MTRLHRAEIARARQQSLETIERINRLLRDSGSPVEVIEPEPPEFVPEDKLDKWRRNRAQGQAAVEEETRRRHAEQRRDLRERQPPPSTVDWSAIDARIEAALFEHSDGVLTDAIGKQVAEACDQQWGELARVAKRLERELKIARETAESALTGEVGRLRLENAALAQRIASIEATTAKDTAQLRVEVGNLHRVVEQLLDRLAETGLRRLPG